MSSTILYTTCVLGALGLYLLLRPAGSGTGARSMKAAGTLLGLGAFGYLLVHAADAIGPAESRPEIFFVLFSLIAIVSATKLITHNKPVYSALYFVLVVLASAGLFLLLEAEFMAFAVIIVYAGAILITYMFVLMLAQQSATADESSGQSEYDMNPREPAAGVIVGFILLALLSRVAVDGVTELPLMRADVAAHGDLVAVESMTSGGEEITVVVADLQSGEESTQTIAIEQLPENVQRVGFALVARFPVSLELAGVILLMAMLGAVILARWQIELTEDETREAAGLRRIGHHDDPDGVGTGGGGA